MGWAGGSNIVMSPPLNMHEQTKERGDIVSSSANVQCAGVDTNDNDQPSVPSQIVHSRDLLDYIEPLEEGLLDYCPWDPSLDEGEEATSEKQETHDLEQDHPSLPFIITNDTEFRKKILAANMQKVSRCV